MNTESTEQSKFQNCVTANVTVPFPEDNIVIGNSSYRTSFLALVSIGSHSAVGVLVGSELGKSEIESVGSKLGIMEGVAEMVSLGDSDGFTEGIVLGSNEPEPNTVDGADEGMTLGYREGPSET